MFNETTLGMCATFHPPLRHQVLTVSPPLQLHRDVFQVGVFMRQQVPLFQHAACCDYRARVPSCVRQA